MDWYYALGTERKGPVDETALKALLASGKISPDTLVWNSSLTDWTAATNTMLLAGLPIPATNAGAELQLCIITGKTFPHSQMIQTEHGWVSAEGRDHYYQSLREGAPIPLAESVTTARSDGKYVVVPVTNAKLPMRCVKTNAPVTASEVKSKTLYWCTPFVLLGIFLSLVVVLILYFVLRKKMAIGIPISAGGKEIVRKHTGIASLALVGAVVGCVVGLVSVGGDKSFVMLLPLGILLLLFGAVYGSRKGSMLRVTKMKDGHAWLAGANQAYVDSLPLYR